MNAQKKVTEPERVSLKSRVEQHVRSTIGIMRRTSSVLQHHTMYQNLAVILRQFNYGKILLWYWSLSSFFPSVSCVKHSKLIEYVEDVRKMFRKHEKRWMIVEVAIAKWIRLRSSSCGPGFKSQAHHHSQILCYFCQCWEKDKNLQKQSGFGPFKKVCAYHP